MISSLRTLYHLCRTGLGALALAGVLLVPQAWSQDEAADHKHRHAPVVLELFTSLICSNCPSADRLAVELHEREDILVLSFHIDYLNMGPLKDPLSHRDWTNRQRWYRELHQSAYVYTPQIVIDGLHTVVGSDKDAVMATLAQARRSAENIAFEAAPDGHLRLRLEPEFSDEFAGRLDLLELHFSKLVRASLSKRGSKVVERLYANSVTHADRRALPAETRELLLSWHEQDFKAQGRAFLLQDRLSGAILGAHWGYRD